MWILLVVLPFASFATVVDSAEECAELGQMNLVYWQQTGQMADAYCVKTAAI